MTGKLIQFVVFKLFLALSLLPPRRGSHMWKLQDLYKYFILISTVQVTKPGLKSHQYDAPPYPLIFFASVLFEFQIS